jgi:hypothetical protein
MSVVTRREARESIARTRVAQLTLDERAKVLSEWWVLDPEDEEWSELPGPLQEEIKAQDEVPSDAMPSKYDPLLRLAMLYETFGVRNSWLQATLSEMAGSDLSIEVVGEPEEMLECRCCEYLTIRERGVYEICPVCFWEDDGSQELDRMSGPNHMTLREARGNFSCFGACSENALRYIVSSVRSMYYQRHDVEIPPERTP